MHHLQSGDIFTKVTRYNLIRNRRMVYIDVHQALFGKLAAPFVAVPNLINLVAKPEYQGVGETEAQALENCLSKINSASIEELFPRGGGGNER
jgi:hypothetical protein